ncbi:Fic family protein [Acetobacterium paludosum]|uniref:Fic family protein n=1 Tax=Acetobacterium paludosum TaxID=52693 RepID=A0A923HVU6_9FIRM|nr:Fic family protein [Acetobacterium paludosum]MBC3889216.1 Fic family protein [Acetobacterium paludosum]
MEKLIKYVTLIDLWKKKNIASINDLDQSLDSFRVLFAYHSNKIENQEITYHDTREIFENGQALNFTGDPRTLFEQQNQKLCYDFLAPKIVNKEPITLELIKEIHFLLTQGTYDQRRFIENNERPGQFKQRDYVVGINEVGEAPEKIPTLLQGLLDEISNTKGDQLKIASHFHARFEFYHPFADGNGRVGRTLLNYFLMINNLPPLIIYDEDKKLYYEALEAYDKTEIIDPLYKFLEYESIKTWNRQIKKPK